MTIPQYPDYNEIHAACKELYHTLGEHHLESSFDYVVGLARGGLLPAVILSHMLKVPMISAHYSSKTGAGDNRDHSNDLPMIDNKRILLVDDICDSGNTLNEVYDIYKLLNCEVTSVVLFCKEENWSIPDFFVWQIPVGFGWIHFPWETC